MRLNSAPLTPGLESPVRGHAVVVGRARVAVEGPSEHLRVELLRAIRVVDRDLEVRRSVGHGASLWPMDRGHPLTGDRQMEPPSPSRHWAGHPAETRTQDVAADQEHPRREDQDDPGRLRRDEQEQERHGVGDERHPPGHHRCPQPERRLREQEDGRHAEGVDVEDLRDEAPREHVRGARREPADDDDALPMAATTAPAEAAAANIIAMNSSPLPRNTVAKNWSSCRPRRSRATAMNQRKNSPAKGTSATAKRSFGAPVWSHVLGFAGQVGDRHADDQDAGPEQDGEQDAGDRAGDGVAARRLAPQRALVVLRCVHPTPAPHGLTKHHCPRCRVGAVRPETESG